MSDVEALFEAGQFGAVVTHLEGKSRSAREATLLGIALIRVGRLEDAEIPLTRAAMLGDQEGQVELGNVMRLLGRFSEAVTHLETIAGGLTGELQLRCLRWWGVAQFQRGQSEEGLRRVERAWHGYLALGDDSMSARVTLSLAQMYRDVGNDRRAKTLLSEAIHVLPKAPYPAPRVSALRQLLEIHLGSGEFAEAREVLRQAKATLGRHDLPLERAHLLSSEAELLRLTGEHAAYGVVLHDLLELANASGDIETRLWVISRLAEHHSLQGQFGKATDVLFSYGTMPGEWPAELWATNGVIERRRGDLIGADASLTKAAQMFRAAGKVPELVRTQLHLAATMLRARRPNFEASLARVLTEALSQLLRLQHLAEFKPDFEELSELLHYAMLEPEVAPLMEPLLDHLAQLAGGARLPEDGAITLAVQTFGHMHVVKDGEPVEFMRKGCVPLLVYLALEPGHTRAEMQLALWPEKDAVTGSAYVRACLKELRDKLGQELIHFEGPHRAPWYRLGKLVHMDLDVTHFREALDRGEVARALALYRGAFLPGADASEWVDTLREELLLSLTFKLRNQMARFEAEGDFKRVVLLANQYVRVDPYDQEVLETRVNAAKVVASPQELAKYVSELNRFNYN